MAASSCSAESPSKMTSASGLGLDGSLDDNPYTALIEACRDDPEKMQASYSAHRNNRNAAQREKFLSSDFKELSIDQILLRLENPKVEPGFQDPRHCLVLWARPPDHIIMLALHVQKLLMATAPNLWLMPPHRMHMTVLEIAHSKTAEEIQALTSQVRDYVPSLASYTYTHRARLVKPKISYDLSAFALSFLPAAGEPPLQTHPEPLYPENSGITNDNSGITNDNSGITNDRYTYHHLRRDIFDEVRSTGVQVASRYQVPSAHITLGRYLKQDDHATPLLREMWVETVDKVNEWLENEVWDHSAGDFIAEWMVGQERGLDVRCGTLWYGGGRTIALGEGF